MKVSAYHSHIYIFTPHNRSTCINKPDLTKTLLSAELDPEQGKIAATRAGKGVKGLQHFMQVSYFFSI